MEGTWSVLVVCCMLFISDALGFRVAVRAPRYVMLGDTAKLVCDYNVAYKDLYKVVWYQNGRKIYQYVKGRTPPQMSSGKNIKIDLSKSDSSNLVLKNANFEVSGLYSCEVTTESPIYSKPSDDVLLTVMESQKEDPQITFRKPIYSVGDQLEVNCTSGMATPTPDVTWLINGKQVQNGLVKSYQQKPSSVTVQLSFQLTDEHLDEINLTCMSTIPGFLGHDASHKEYADHRTQSVTVQVKAPTVVNKSGAERTAAVHQTLVFMMMLLASGVIYQLHSA
uniref:Ig-like domain-containing protein n=1 Tax=Cacopsylla melanoneura TaxID=428564 RepID=A0A8D8WZN2_9HEMI